MSNDHISAPGNQDLGSAFRAQAKRRLLREIISITPPGIRPRVMLSELIETGALPQIAEEMGLRPA